MGKIDWSKVEKLLGKGIEDIEITNFQAAVAKLMLANEEPVVREGPDTVPSKEAIQKVISMCWRDLKILKDKDITLLQEVLEEGKELKALEEKLLADKEEFTLEEWGRVRELKDYFNKKKFELVATLGQRMEDHIVEENTLTLKKKGRYFFGVSQRKDWRTV